MLGQQSLRRLQVKGRPGGCSVSSMSCCDSMMIFASSLPHCQATCTCCFHHTPVKWHLQHDFLITFLLFAEAIDLPWGVPASFNASAVTIVDRNTSRYRDVAAVVGDTVTIHWNSSSGGNYSLWQIPSRQCCPTQCTLTAVQFPVLLP